MENVEEDLVMFYVICKIDKSRIPIPASKIKWLIDHATDKPFTEIYDIGYKMLGDILPIRITEVQFYKMVDDIENQKLKEDCYD